LAPSTPRPQWSTVTDSYAAADADIVSWAIIIAMVLAGLALVLVAARSDRSPLVERGSAGSRLL
jgi:hypothetical protein